MLIWGLGIGDWGLGIGDWAEKADKMVEAFKKGFDEATKTWGKELPDISKRTYDAVLEKMDQWKNGTYKSGETEA